LQISWAGKIKKRTEINTSKGTRRIQVPFDVFKEENNGALFYVILLDAKLTGQT
jgi:hypothetical protein